MRLKSLEIIGFKSFADKVVVDLSNNVTCFVGPNGCGKSNVVDAIKWVLGEQRVTALRGNRMFDVIFNGNASGRRTQMNFAEVSLTVINDQGILPIDFEEVVVTRRLYRTGESEYLLNRSTVRLKDIKKLFMNTGVGLDAYSIMEQGKIDGILEANPRDRRAIFEEAAGISLYKSQRREAERKLDATRANLLRLGDIIEELEKRIRSLKNQAGRARSYLRLNEEITGLRKDYYCHLYERLTTSLDELETSLESVLEEERKGRSELAAWNEETSELDSEIATVKEELYVMRSRSAEINTTLEEGQGKIEYHEGRLQEIDRELQSIEDRDRDLSARFQQREEEQGRIVEALERLTFDEKTLREDERKKRALMETAAAQLATCGEGIEELENSIVDLSRREVSVGNREVEVRAGLRGSHAARRRVVRRQHESVQTLYEHRCASAGLQSKILEKDGNICGLKNELTTGRQKAGALEEGLGELDGEIRTLEAERVKSESRIELLESLLAQREGVGAGAKAVMAEAAREGSSLPFVFGILGELLDVDIEFSKALESVLGDLDEALVVKEPNEACRVLDFLRERDLEGVNVLVQSRFHNHQDAGGPAGGNTIESLARRVQCNTNLNGFVDELLSQVELLGNGSLNENHMQAGGTPCVTVKGDFYRRGLLRVGRSQEPGVITRRSELTALRRGMSRLEEKLESFEMRRRTLQKSLHEARSANEVLAGRLAAEEAERASLAAERDKIQEHRSHLFRELKLHLEECFDIERSVQELGRELRKLKEKKLIIAAEVSGHSKSLDRAILEAESFRAESAQLEEELKGLEIRLVEHNGRCESLSKERHLLDQSLEESRSRLGELAEDRLRLQTGGERSRTEIAHLTERTEGFAKEASDLDDATAEVEARLFEKETKLERKNLEVQRHQENLEVQRERLESLKMEIRGVEVKQQGLRERARENLGIEIDEVHLSGEAQEEIDLEATDQQIRTIKDRIARIGNVNLEAVAELEREEERYNHLVGQRDDLLKAQKSLQELISELNNKSRTLFQETFEMVRSHFNGVFRKLFHGGRADIRLEEGEDILETGIEIIAGPPRKDVRAISLLSGGEKTLTAVALLFALFKARPSPFCLLDEVDAALDETNIERFCSLLNDFVKGSQFMIVTHSKRTMSYANILYGVTMEEGGVSKLVSMKLEDYQERVA